MKATTAITIIIMMCFIPATYVPEPIFPAAIPPNTASIIDMLKRTLFNDLMSMFEIEDKNPPPLFVPGELFSKCWTSSN